MEPISFFVPGVPRPAGSKTAFPFKRRDGSLGASVVDSCKHTKPWQAVVSGEARDIYAGPILTGPIQLELAFNFLRPKSHYGTGRNANRLKPSAPMHHTVKPDIDKLIRAILDALTGPIWQRDQQVTYLTARKLYDVQPGATITITPRDERGEE